MPNPDQRYIDAIVNHNPVLLEEIYQKYSANIIKGYSIGNSGKEQDLQKISQLAGDVFRKTLLSIRHKAKQPSFILTYSFAEFFFKEYKKIKENGLSLAEPCEYYDKKTNDIDVLEAGQAEKARINLIQQALSKLGTGCQKILLLYWSKESLEELVRINSIENISLNRVEGRKLKSKCMQKLIELLGPEFRSKI